MILMVGCPMLPYCSNQLLITKGNPQVLSQSLPHLCLLFWRHKENHKSRIVSTKELAIDHLSHPYKQRSPVPNHISKNIGKF